MPTPGPLARPAAILLLAAAPVIAAFALYDAPRQPLLGDRAYLAYMGPAVARGEPIYDTTTFGYPPVAPLLAAGAIRALEPLGTPPWLAQRWAGILAAIVTAWALALFTRRATGSLAAAAGAAIVFAGFGHAIVLASGGLEPKSLVGTFAVLAVLAAQRERWILAGLAGALAAGAWLPGIVALAAVAVQAGAGARREGVARVAAGAALAAAGPALYLGITGGWAGFVDRGLLVKAERYGPGLADLGSGFRSLAGTVWVRYRPEIGLLAAALAGFGVRLARGREGWLEPGLGGAVPLTLGFGLLLLADQVGADDLVVYVPVFAFWAAVAGLEAARAVARATEATAGRAAAAGLLGVALVYGHADGLDYERPADLADQRAAVERIEAQVPPGGTLLVVGAPEVYVLADRPAAWRWLLLRPYFDRVVERSEPGGCAGLLRRFREESWDVVVLDVPRHEGRCQGALREAAEADRSWWSVGFAAHRERRADGGAAPLRLHERRVYGPPGSGAR